MFVKLFTRNDGFVVEGVIPPFSQPPDILIWGTRVFKFSAEMIDPKDNNREFLRYEECFAYYLITKK